MSEPASPEGDVTLLLQRLNDGDPAAARDLFAAVYDQLRRRADQFMAQERADHTLQPTALVNEAFVRLIESPALSWKGSRHFYNAVAEAMRQILVDHARRKNAAKRGGGRARVELERVDMESPQPVAGESEVDHEALDRALTKLRAEDERRYQVVMYRYFAALPEKQIAELLGISEKTVRRDWQTAKLFLLAEIEDANGG